MEKIGGAHRSGVVSPMARTASKLALAPAPRTAERIALAAAVDRHNAALRRVAANAKAQEATASAISNARDAVAKATTALEAAKTNAASSLAGVLRRPPRLSVKAARAELEAAVDLLEAALASEMILTTQHEAAEQATIFSRMALDHRLRDVVRSDASIAKLLAEHERAHREMVGLRNALQFLDRKDFLPADARLWACERDDWPEQAAETARWKAAIASLEIDANMALPI
jgi:hypothetical protein